MRFTTIAANAAPRLSRITLGLGIADGSLDSIGVLVSNEGSPFVCFTPATDDVTLELTSGNGRMSPVEITRSGARCDALLVSVLSNRGSELTPLTFFDVSEIELTASGSTVDVDSLSGKVALANVTSRVLDPAQHMVIAAGSSSSIDIGLSTSDLGHRFSIGPSGVKSVLTDEGEMVPARWSSMQPFALPILLALFAALVWPAVSAGTQRFVGWLGGRGH
jgi:hypothetical protein